MSLHFDNPKEYSYRKAVIDTDSSHISDFDDVWTVVKGIDIEYLCKRFNDLEGKYNVSDLTTLQTTITYTINKIKNGTDGVLDKKKSSSPVVTRAAEDMYLMLDRINDEINKQLALSKSTSKLSKVVKSIKSKWADASRAYDKFSGVAKASDKVFTDALKTHGESIFSFGRKK